MLPKWLSEWIKKDFVYLIVICFALGACAYTLLHTNAINDKCNVDYQKYIDEYCSCSTHKINFDNALNYTLKIEGVDKNG